LNQRARFTALCYAFLWEQLSVKTESMK
jgi:hypothetical protein